MLKRSDRGYCRQRAVTRLAAASLEGVPGLRAGLSGTLCPCQSTASAHPVQRQNEGAKGTPVRKAKRKKARDSGSGGGMQLHLEIRGGDGRHPQAQRHVFALKAVQRGFVSLKNSSSNVSTQNVATAAGKGRVGCTCNEEKAARKDEGHEKGARLLLRGSAGTAGSPVYWNSCHLPARSTDQSLRKDPHHRFCSVSISMPSTVARILSGRETA